jgi:hypothetical protein
VVGAIDERINRHRHGQRPPVAAPHSLGDRQGGQGDNVSACRIRRRPELGSTRDAPSGWTSRAHVQVAACSNR